MKKPSQIRKNDSPRASVPQATTQPSSVSKRNSEGADTLPLMALFPDGIDGDSDDLIDFSASEYAQIKRSAIAVGVSPGLYIADAALEKSGAQAPGRNVTIVFQDFSGVELGRVDFPHEAFLKICRAASLLDISIPRFFNLSLAKACMKQGLYSTLERREA